MTGSQYKILKYLICHPDEAVRQVDLEKNYSLTHPSTIGLLKQLEKKGFIQRQKNPEDGRSQIVSLTKQSLEMKDELENVGELIEEKLTAALTEDERLQLIWLLQKLLSEFK